MSSLSKAWLRFLGTGVMGLVCIVPARAGRLDLPPAAKEGLHELYSGAPDAAIELFRRVQQQQPDHPLGYLLEADARWWKIYCASCEVRWGTIDAWKRRKLREDDAYFGLADRAIQLAEDSLKRKDSPEMRLYAGLAWMLKGRLDGLRDERRATAQAGVRGREHLLRALELDPELADANAGLGLYNYYVDTLSAFARVLRFLMGIPGGSKKEGIRQLETAMAKGELTAVEARFYLAKNLRNYDQQYERAAELMEPLVQEYPKNPLFYLLLGDMQAKLRRNEKAAANFHAAQKLSVHDPTCAARLRQVAEIVLAALRPSVTAKPAGGTH